MSSFLCRLLNFNGYVLTACVSRSLHYLTNCLCNSSVTADYHAGVVLCNGENKLNVIAVYGFFNLYCVGIINDSTGNVGKSKEYQKFRKDRIITVEGRELVGDTTLTKLLYERMLCGAYNQEKLNAFRDLVESTGDRLIVFYNFNAELNKMQQILMDEDFENHKRFSIVNGEIKALKNYEDRADSITFVQYQAGAMGLNLQKACRIIYFTPPLSSELYQQSMKRIHRIGQGSTCFYYKLICKPLSRSYVSSVL